MSSSKRSTRKWLAESLEKLSGPKKSLGQNFLMHARTAERIADAANLSPDATVLEIGPGTGMLTVPLLARAKRVIAVEADDDLAEELKDTFAKEIANDSFILFHDDIRTFDTANLPDSYDIVANIPYYITGEIIRSFLSSSKKPSSMTLLVQKEVAERIARSKKESLLSLSVKAYGEPVYCFTVPRGAFRPAPNVDSAVLRIGNIRKDTFSSLSEENLFFAMIHAGFAHKRKRLAKNLEDVFKAIDIENAFDELSIEKNARAEDLSLQAWRSLAAAIQKHAA